jgi:hypothetical protein
MQAQAQFSEAGLLSFLREEFNREERSGFARLSQVPSTWVMKFLKYYRCLSAQEAATLRSALRLRAFHFVRHLAKDQSALWPDTLTPQERQAYKSFSDAMVQKWWGWDTQPLRPLMQMAKSQKTDLESCNEISPPEVLEWAASLKAADARELRKLVKYALAERHALQPQKFGAGVWLYKNADPLSQVQVLIDYGGRDRQMEYQVSLRYEEPRIQLKDSSFEQLLGLSFSTWDFILESQADQKIALLRDLIDYVMRLPRRLQDALH